MGLSWLKFFWLTFFILHVSLIAEEKISRKHPLFLLQAQKTTEAFDQYQKYCAQEKKMDLSLLQDMARIILEQGAQSKDDQIFLLTMYGAGQALSSRSLEILAKGVTSHNPEIQMAALYFLSKMEDDSADKFLLKAMASPLLPMRLEALYFLTERKHLAALGQAESLMNRLPQEIKPLFVQIFANLATRDAISYWKNFFHDLSPQVRLEAILQTAFHKRDDLLPIIRQKCLHPNAAEQEACAFVLGELSDSVSIPLLKKLAASVSDNLVLSASMALVRLGHKESMADIEALAKHQNIFATMALAEIGEKPSPVLFSLLNSFDFNVRFNAACALLEKKDARSLKVLEEFFFQEDLEVKPVFSLGHSQRAWQVSSEAHHEQVTEQIKEYLCKKIGDLPEDDCLPFITKIFDNYKRGLVPIAIAMLENFHSEKSFELLKKFAKKEDRPLVRDYCRLALFRQNQDPSYEKEIKEWLLFACKNRLIRLQPYIPWQMRLDPKSFSFTPEETSRLLVESYLALASKRDEESLQTIVESFKIGSKYNRPVLAGLILRVTE